MPDEAAEMRAKGERHLTVECGVRQEGGCPVSEAAAGSGLEKRLIRGGQRGWGRENTSDGT